jgi:hypothetical protein
MELRNFSSWGAKITGSCQTGVTEPHFWVLVWESSIKGGGTWGIWWCYFLLPMQRSCQHWFCGSWNEGNEFLCGGSELLSPVVCFFKDMIRLDEAPTTILHVVLYALGLDALLAKEQAQMKLSLLLLEWAALIPFLITDLFWVLDNFMTESSCCFWKCNRNSGHKFS